MSVTFERRGPVGWATIRRPEALNALDGAHLRDLLAVMRDAAGDAATRALVVTGTGRAFSVGADIKAMDRMTEAEFAGVAALYQELAGATRDLDKPVLGAINGYALGGGLELALMCDLRLAAASAQLGLPDAALGFSPTGGLTHLLPRVVGLGRALHLALAAEPIDAHEAERIGLVTRVVADGALAETAQDWAEKIASWPRIGIANIKRSLHAGSDSGFADALILEATCDAACYASPETRQRLKNFIESRKKKKKRTT